MSVSQEDITTLNQLNAYQTMNDHVKEIYRVKPSHLKTLLDEIDAAVDDGTTDLTNDFYDQENKIPMGEYYDCLYDWYLNIVAGNQKVNML